MFLKQWLRFSPRLRLCLSYWRSLYNKHVSIKGALEILSFVWKYWWARGGLFTRGRYHCQTKFVNLGACVLATPTKAQPSIGPTMEVAIPSQPVGFRLVWTLRKKISIVKALNRLRENAQPMLLVGVAKTKRSPVRWIWGTESTASSGAQTHSLVSTWSG